MGHLDFLPLSPMLRLCLSWSCRDSCSQTVVHPYVQQPSCVQTHSCCATNYPLSLTFFPSPLPQSSLSLVFTHACVEGVYLCLCLCVGVYLCVHVCDIHRGQRTSSGAILSSNPLWDCSLLAWNLFSCWLTSRPRASPVSAFTALEIHLCHHIWYFYVGSQAFLLEWKALLILTPIVSINLSILLLCLNRLPFKHSIFH